MLNIEYTYMNKTICSYLNFFSLYLFSKKNVKKNKYKQSGPD